MPSDIKQLIRRKSIVQIVLSATLIAVLIAALGNQIVKSVYQERQELLSLSTNTAAGVVNQNIDKEWEILNVLLGSINHACIEKDDVDSAFSLINGLNDFGADYYFLVDTEGKYYSSDGKYGKLQEYSEYLSDTPDKTVYLSTLPHLDAQKTYMIFRKRLETPISIGTSKGAAEMCYFAYAQDLTEIMSKMTDIYKSQVNMFLYDANGTMLFKHFGIKLLLEGYSIYPKFALCNPRFGEDPDTLVQKCKDREPFVVEMNIGGQEYYFCSTPLNVSDFSMAFVIDSRFIESVSSNSFTFVIFYIFMIAAVLCLAIVGMSRARTRHRTVESKLKESQKLATALAAASKAKTDFLSNMSHDIRTPINGIMGMTTLAKGSLGEPEKTREYLDKVDKASHHLLSLVNDVLDMSRIESGKTDISCSPVDIRVLCDNCCSIIHGQISGRDLDFIVDIEATHARVMADNLHLRQVIINLLGNSVKFTNDGGKIWFRCKEESFDDDTVTYRMEVEDTGIGMSREFMDRLFEPFSQESNNARSQYQGTGLGMAISKKLVDLMKGTIEVESELGKGSKFIVTIPFEINKEPEETMVIGDEDANIEGIKVLLVEDNELNREIATEFLTMNGAAVDSVDNGALAVEKFSSNAEGTYDVILMDIMMPVMNGLDAARAIRALKREDASRIPIIAMTANAFDDDIKATKEAGMNAHLSKPIEMDKVIKTISQFCKTNKPSGV